jgi:hypothetical protein
MMACDPGRAWRAGRARPPSRHKGTAGRRACGLERPLATAAARDSKVSAGITGVIAGNRCLRVRARLPYGVEDLCAPCEGGKSHQSPHPLLGSPPAGVVFSSEGWRAEIEVDGRPRWLGTFKDQASAARAYKASQANPPPPAARARDSTTLQTTCPSGPVPLLMSRLSPQAEEEKLERRAAQSTPSKAAASTPSTKVI